MLRGSSSIAENRNNAAARLRPLGRNLCANEESEELRIAAQHVLTHVLKCSRNRRGCDANTQEYEARC